MSAAAVGIGGVVAVGMRGAAEQGISIALGALTAFMFTGAGNALNDFYDQDIDRTNHPDRPIPSGMVTPRAAFDLAFALFLLAIAASVFINLAAFGLVLLSLFLMIAYEVRFKSSGGGGNLLIGWLVGSLFLFAGLCVYGGSVAPLQIAASMAVLAGLSTVGRDVGRRTIPKAHGVRYAARVAQAFTLAAVGLSGVPAAFTILSAWYVPLVAVADGILICAAFYTAHSAPRSERLMKVGMAVALIAFLVGGVG